MVVFAEIITNDSLLLVWMSPQTSQREAGFAVSDHIAHREHCPSHAAYDGNSVRFSVRIGRWRLTVEFSAAGVCCGMFPKPRLAGECSANCGASLVLCSELSAPVASRARDAACRIADVESHLALRVRSYNIFTTTNVRSSASAFVSRN